MHYVCNFLYIKYWDLRDLETSVLLGLDQLGRVQDRPVDILCATFEHFKADLDLKHSVHFADI